MDDTIETIFTKAGLSSNTQKAYRYAYAKLFDSGLFKRRISSTSNENIISNINEISTNPNTVAMLINICILIKRHYNKDDG